MHLFLVHCKCQVYLLHSKLLEGMRMTNKLKILVVEDEAITAMCLCSDLSDFDVEPLEPVAKGEIAIEIALQEKPVIVEQLKHKYEKHDF